MRNAAKAGGTVKKKMESGGNTSIRRRRINSLNNRTDKVWTKMMDETQSSSPNQNKVNRLNAKMNRLEGRQMQLIDKDIEKDRIKGTSVMKKGGQTKKKYNAGGGVIPSSPIVASPIQGRTTNRPVAGNPMKRGGSTSFGMLSVKKGVDNNPAPTKADQIAGATMKRGGGVKHPGFKAVQAKIAAKSGVSKKAAGAILAASTRKASAKAKAANPRLKRVKG
jgi:hypothetical protein